MHDDENVVPFYRKASDGGNAGENWLIKLPVDCVFIARKKDTYMPMEYLFEFTVVQKVGTAVFLIMDAGEEDLHFWVDSEKFSQNHVLFEVLKGDFHGQGNIYKT